MTDCSGFTLWHDRLHVVYVMTWQIARGLHCDVTNCMWFTLCHDQVHVVYIVTWATTSGLHCDTTNYIWFTLWRDHLHMVYIVTWPTTHGLHCDMTNYTWFTLWHDRQQVVYVVTWQTTRGLRCDMTDCMWLTLWHDRLQVVDVVTWLTARGSRFVAEELEDERRHVEQERNITSTLQSRWYFGVSILHLHLRLPLPLFFFFFKCSFTFSETRRSIGDGEPRTSTSTITQLLISELPLSSVWHLYFPARSVSPPLLSLYSLILYPTLCFKFGIFTPYSPSLTLSSSGSILSIQRNLPMLRAQRCQEFPLVNPDVSRVPSCKPRGVKGSLL